MDYYFHHRIESLLKHVLPVLGVKEYIVRYEAQHRGTMHAHLLLNVRFGPSADELKNAYLFKPTTVEPEILEAKDRLIWFTKMLGISAMHPQPQVELWPPPEGGAYRRPQTNILRQRFTDIDAEDEEGFRDRYEKLINRTMLHQCREGYCLNKDKKTVCRFGFEKDYVGFVPIWDVTGRNLQAVGRDQNLCPEGVEIHKGGMLLLRNHPRLVTHIPALLNIWQANIEGRPVKNYQQVVRYLIKYMMKEEPNSSSFDAIMRASIEEVDEDDPVRKVFMKTLNRT